MHEVTAPVYSEKINLKLPGRLGIMFLLSASILLYRRSLKLFKFDFDHITVHYVLH